MSKPTTPPHLTWHSGRVSRADRQRSLGHRGATLWLTGLSGSGKSTIARAVEQQLFERGCAVYVLDGDNIRHGLNSDLGFDAASRSENIRRIGEVAKLFTDAGVLVLAALISPYRDDRDSVRKRLGSGDFVEIYVDTPVEVCEQRDPKGLYKKARAGEIPEFTGVSAPYETPASPDVHLDTTRLEPEACSAKVVRWLDEHGYLSVQTPKTP